MRTVLGVLAAVHLVSCMAARPQTSSPLAAEAESVPDEILSGLAGSIQTLDANSFKNYNVGDVSTDTTFPKAYIALPLLSDFVSEDFSMTVQGYMQIGSVPTGITMQYTKGHWQTYTGQEITRYEIGLLDSPKTKLDLELNGSLIDWEKQTVTLDAGKVVNPFVGMQVIKIDPSKMKWITAFRDGKQKLINMNVSVVDQNDQRLLNSSISYVRVGTALEAPKSFILAISNRDLSKTKVVIQANYRDATGQVKRGQRTFRSFDDVFALK